MDILNRQFGLVIAYLLPGFIVLAGIAPFAPLVAGWLEPSVQGLGPPAYAVLAATTAGMIASSFRWLLIDSIHSLTGVPTPAFNAGALKDSPDAFNLLVESHYRYYQFYANTLVSLIWTYGIHRILRVSSFLRFGTDVGVFILCAVLFAGSRDALFKYRHRTGHLIGRIERKEFTGEGMTNGIDHNQGNGGSAKNAPRPKPVNQPQATPKPQQNEPAEKQVSKPPAS